MRQWAQNTALAGMVAAGFFLTGCASRQPEPPVAEEPVLFEWFGDGMEGPIRVVIDLTVQRAQIYIGGEYAGWTVVATGKEGYGTPAGEYSVLEKVVDKESTIYGKIVDADGNTVRGDADIRKHSVPSGGRFVHAPMPYWMRVTWRGIGMHAGPIPKPGSPASHGCIRLPRDMAITLFSRVEIGTPVRIVR